MTIARISITIPRPLVAAADRRAKELDRSRSWVVTEALRQYFGYSEPPRAGRRGSTLGEPAAVPYGAPPAVGLGPHRLAQLEADLALTPTERVREAEQTARVSELRRRGARGNRILTFDHYEDYLEWKRGEDVAPL